MKIFIIVLFIGILCSCSSEKYIVAIEHDNELKVYKTNDIAFVDSTFKAEFGDTSLIKNSIFYEIRMKDSLQSKSVYYERKR